VTFAARLPTWIGADGFPLSWRHWIYGQAWIGREHQREQLRIAQAHRWAGFQKSDFETLQRDIETVTGVPKNASR